MAVDALVASISVHGTVATLLPVLHLALHDGIRGGAEVNVVVVVGKNASRGDGSED